MTLLAQLGDRQTWERFYEYKCALACPKAFTAELRAFIDAEGYLPVCRAIERGERFPLPRRSLIGKLGSEKKRVVYTYPPAENTVLKLLTHLLLRRCDGLFADNLWSFRPGRTAKDAIRALLRTPGVADMYACKTDVSDYFNSIPVPLLLPLLDDALPDDPALRRFLCALLSEPEALDRGKPVAEQKGIMAGTPLSAFFANLYLAELDRHFAEAGVPYARYSDDVILFAETREALDARAAALWDGLAARGLRQNPEKTAVFAPGEGFTFLGFRCVGDKVDIAPATVRKLKAKMRRKRDALSRWRKRNGLPGEKAAAAFIRVFNRKLLENAGDSELTWSRWFFSVINVTDSLREIDRCAQDCLRYLIAGTHTKARFNVRYETLKALGYRSLVHAYYEGANDQERFCDCERGVRSEE